LESETFEIRAKAVPLNDIRKYENALGPY